jgi:tripartite-type tricarboxylate transporter receptor subunit TctC
MTIKINMPSCAAATLLAFLASPAGAQDFYKGKTINLIVGFSPGGTYDLTARLLGRHVGNHIPGKPSVVVQTMTGAGGFTAVMYLYNSAARDGTVIGMPPRNFPIAPFANDQLRYDGHGFNVIGSTTTEVQVCAVWHAAGVSKIDDLLTREITAGITSYYDDIGSLTLVTKNITGVKLKIINGYPGGNDISTAMEKGEVDAECGWSWGSMKTRARPWLEQKKVNVILQIGSKKASDLPDVPFIMDYAKNDLDRKALELLMAPDAFAWPFVAPPGVPAERVATLRQAFDGAMKDPALLAEAKQMNLEINPIGGAEIQEKIKRILDFDPAVIARAKELVNPQN